MRIGIDISQIAYEKTGVATYLENLVKALIAGDKKNEYVLFFSSLRRRLDKSFVEELESVDSPRIKLKSYPFPPLLLDTLWNKLHVWPIEWFVGNIDIFITSDWTEPPARWAKKATILYDLTVLTTSQETDKKIINTQKRKLSWVRKESSVIFCISEATKKDAQRLLGLEEKKLKVVYPGFSL